ncbi:hypothetical protein VTK73DRAFT_2798 [Phialemonium thermophilum]|uniref:Uncharacterized protein n=1 Tax=Phialemonium thermophilum TaxID=223376 RepID=A0ABR3X2U3_9PEZI
MLFWPLPRTPRAGTKVYNTPGAQAMGFALATTSAGRCVRSCHLFGDFFLLDAEWRGSNTTLDMTWKGLTILRRQLFCFHLRLILASIFLRRVFSLRCVFGAYRRVLERYGFYLPLSTKTGCKIVPLQARSSTLQREPTHEEALKYTHLIAPRFSYLSPTVDSITVHSKEQPVTFSENTNYKMYLDAENHTLADLCLFCIPYANQIFPRRQGASPRIYGRASMSVSLAKYEESLLNGSTRFVLSPSLPLDTSQCCLLGKMEVQPGCTASPRRGPPKQALFQAPTRWLPEGLADQTATDPACRV